MKNEDYHKPFIKSLVFVAVVTMVGVFFCHYLTNSFQNLHNKPSKNTRANIQFSTR